MSTSAEVLAVVAPEVAARADASTWISIAAAQLTASAWGAVYVYAVCYLAAHMATLSPEDEDDSAANAGNAGAVSGWGEGDISENYSAATAGVTNLTTGDADLMTTKYGRQYLRLRGTRSAVAPGIISING